MAVTDIAPDRYSRAKSQIYDILDTFPNYRIGLINFTEIPHIISPLTTDHKSIEEKLRAIKTQDFYLQGSNINNAIKMSLNYLKKIPSDDKYIIILSDGDFTSVIDNKILNNAKKQNIKFFIYGYGTKIGGPVFKSGRMISYQGKNVISKINIDNLEKVRESLAAGMVINKNGNKNLTDFIEANSALSKTTSSYTQWHERFYIFLLPAMLLLLYFFRPGIIMSLLLMSLLIPNKAKANIFLNKDQQALKEYKKNNYQESSKHFSSPYNKGNAAYKAKDYKSAINNFSNSANNIKSQFNLGNSHFMNQNFQEAIKAYDNVIKIDPENNKAKHNKKIAKEMLKQQQKNKDKNQKDNKKNKEDKSDDSGQDQKDKQKNDQSENKQQKEQQQQNQQQNKDAKQSDKEPKDFNPDENIFNLIESDPRNLIKRKIQNKEYNSKVKNKKTW
jgi:Ca-activated chloride channel family protein